MAGKGGPSPLRNEGPLGDTNSEAQLYVRWSVWVPENDENWRPCCLSCKSPMSTLLEDILLACVQGSEWGEREGQARYGQHWQRSTFPVAPTPIAPTCARPVSVCHSVCVELQPNFHLEESGNEAPFGNGWGLPKPCWFETFDFEAACGTAAAIPMVHSFAQDL